MPGGTLGENPYDEPAKKRLAFGDWHVATDMNEAIGPSGNMVLRVAVTIAVVAVVLFVGIAIGSCSYDATEGVEKVRKLYDFPDGGSGSDSIASAGLYRGAALYDIKLSTKAHLVVLYDNTTSSVAMVPWPDPTSPSTGYLYVTPYERDEVLRRIRTRETQDQRAMDGEDVYGFRYTGKVVATVEPGGELPEELQEKETEEGDQE